VESTVKDAAADVISVSLIRSIEGVLFYGACLIDLRAIDLD
jgi:hypothetical protein